MAVVGGLGLWVPSDLLHITTFEGKNKSDLFFQVWLHIHDMYRVHMVHVLTLSSKLFF